MARPRGRGPAAATLAAMLAMAVAHTAAAQALHPGTAHYSHYYVNGRRPPGTLLLNMLIKNEEEHLARTLPAWARIIDAWVIGVDDNNTDASREVITRALGHLPGKMVTVHFDGMGPTWTRLVEAGWEAFPHVTHGILADADFAPLSASMDKMELDIRASKALYTIYSADHAHKRKLDWVYRNMPGVTVQRRTHQALVVPELPDQEVFITELATLRVDERPGGYQDRAGGARAKAQRYIDFLEADLAEFGANDTRSLYYLGVGYLDLYKHGVEEHGGVPNDEDRAALVAATAYYERRAAIVGVDVGTREERWFAVLKLGEIAERFRGDWHTACRYFLQAVRLDAERADGWYYAGQNMRLRGDAALAVPLLEVAAHLPMPNRALFHWATLYSCLAKVEYVRAVVAAVGASRGASVLDVCIGTPAAPATSATADDIIDFGLRDGGEDDVAVAAAVALPARPYNSYIATPRPVTLRQVEDALTAATTAAAVCRADGEPAAAFDAVRLLPIISDMAADARRQRAAALASGACRRSAPNTPPTTAARVPAPAPVPTRPASIFVLPPRPPPPPSSASLQQQQYLSQQQLDGALRRWLVDVLASMGTVCAKLPGSGGAWECERRAPSDPLPAYVQPLVSKLSTTAHAALAAASAAATSSAVAAVEARAAPCTCRVVRALLRSWRAALADVRPPPTGPAAAVAAWEVLHDATAPAWQRCT